MGSWVFFAFLSAFFASLVALFGKIGIAHIDSTLATTVRAIIMAIFLIIVSLSLKKFQLLKTFDQKAMLFIVLAGIAGALSWLCYFYALKIGPVKAVAAIDKTSVALAIIFAAIFLKESLTLLNILGMVLLLAGVYLLM